ncbi:MAG: septum formation protein Maf [Gammaproteobacteria bacterium]|nr:septum formation protein Maf [Gammaproteobacteria bacterium]
MSQGAVRAPGVREIVLASSSPYRRELLERLKVPFVWSAPAVDEQPFDGEAPEATVRRLAESKARSLVRAHPDALIIGSDQVAVSADGGLLNKPGNRETARLLLQRSSGRAIRFLTGLCLLDGKSGRAQVDLSECEVSFRKLTDGEIERYLDVEQPYDCAGAFKSEKLGIALLESMSLPDPTALVGLPLIALSAMLRRAGVPVP